MELDNMISRLLMIYNNETITLSKNSYRNYEKIIIELVRIKYGIRYHEYNRECNCQPECIIKGILKNDNELKEFLDKKCHNSLEKIIKKKINKNKTIWGENE